MSVLVLAEDAENYNKDTKPKFSDLTLVPLWLISNNFRTFFKMFLFDLELVFRTSATSDWVKVNH